MYFILWACHHLKVHIPSMFPRSDPDGHSTHFLWKRTETTTKPLFFCFRPLSPGAFGLPDIPKLPPVVLWLNYQLETDSPASLVLAWERTDLTCHLLSCQQCLCPVGMSGRSWQSCQSHPEFGEERRSGWVRGQVWFDWLHFWRLQSLGKHASVGTIQMESFVRTLVWPSSWRSEMRLALGWEGRQMGCGLPCQHLNSGISKHPAQK